MTLRINRAVFDKRAERRDLAAQLAAGTEQEPHTPHAPDTLSFNGDELPCSHPDATAAVAALQTLHESLLSQLGVPAVAMVPMLSAILRSVYLLEPKAPVHATHPVLRGFPVTPPRTVDELEALFNRLEDILLLKVPYSPTEQGSPAASALKEGRA